MKVYVIILTIDFSGAMALGAFKNKEMALDAFRKDVEDNFEDGYVITEEGGENVYDCLEYCILECDDADSPTLFYSISELELV